MADFDRLLYILMALAINITFMANPMIACRGQEELENRFFDL